MLGNVKHMDFVEYIGRLDFQVFEQFFLGVAVVVHLEPFLGLHVALYFRLINIIIANVCVLSVVALLLNDVDVPLDL